MNERIKKLKDKIWTEEYWTNPNTDKLLPAQLNKFAELIVKECGNWFNSRLVVEPDYGMEHRIERNRAVVGVMKEFNQHFGVEE